LQAGDGSLDDFLPGIAQGAQTWLNSKTYAQHAYISRMRNQLAPIWRKSIHEKVNALFLSGRTLAQHKYVTKVRATLDAQGALKEVRVSVGSGMERLDVTALEAFEAASPFPNPPKQLISREGLIEVSWNFLVRQQATQLTLAAPEQRVIRRNL
jgi:protein TonB